MLHRLSSGNREHSTRKSSIRYSTVTGSTCDSVRCLQKTEEAHSVGIPRSGKGIYQDVDLVIEIEIAEDTARLLGINGYNSEFDLRLLYKPTYLPLHTPPPSASYPVIPSRPTYISIPSAPNVSHFRRSSFGPEQGNPTAAVSRQARKN